MSTLTKSSAVNRIQDELKNLSPQELRMVEITIRNLRNNHTAAGHSEKENDNPDITEDVRICPEPEDVLEFMKHWEGCLSDLPVLDKKQLREMRLNEKYGE